jgi:3-methyladenine DNA glycosylase Mpg
VRGNKSFSTSRFPARELPVSDALKKGDRRRASGDKSDFKRRRRKPAVHGVESKASKTGSSFSGNGKICICLCVNTHVNVIEWLTTKALVSRKKSGKFARVTTIYG